MCSLTGPQFNKVARGLSVKLERKGRVEVKTNPGNSPQGVCQSRNRVCLSRRTICLPVRHRCCPKEFQVERSFLPIGQLFNSQQRHFGIVVTSFNKGVLTFVLSGHCPQWQARTTSTLINCCLFSTFVTFHSLAPLLEQYGQRGPRAQLGSITDSANGRVEKAARQKDSIRVAAKNERVTSAHSES